MHETTHIELTDRELKLFQSLIKQRCGISFPDNKRRLLEKKLAQRLVGADFSCFTDYYFHLIHRDTDQSELRNLLDNVTTNQTTFFREPAHFEFLVDTVFHLIEKRKQKDPKYFLRIWSAGCATGEEAYSIAFAVKNHFKRFTPRHGRILGTDISTKALKHAVEGQYDTAPIGAFAGNARGRWMETVYTGSTPAYRVVPEIKELVEFRRLNLATQPFRFRHRFDAIFCRNVMMYFDAPTKETVVNKFAGVLRHGGFLVTGHAENLMNVAMPLKRLQSSIFMME